MSTDRVIDGLSYPIVIAADAAKTLPPLVAQYRRAVIVHDRRVTDRAKSIASALATAGVAPADAIAIDAGERTKRLESAASLYDEFVERGTERSTLVVAVGGGTTTDLVGFAAATYMRGLSWAAVPTTVLGMADAAIGGKTGVDLRAGKNLVGAFWNPIAVVADLRSLETLPDRERRTGLAEAIKCAIIAEPDLLDRIATMPSDAPPEWWRDVIAEAARVKAHIVAADPRESGRRAVLNLGHTVGHALETATRYRMAHGEAVAVGIRAAGLMSRTRGDWPLGDHVRVLNVMRRVGLPVFARAVKADAVMSGITRDKKVVDGRVRFVLPVSIGDVRHGIEVDTAVALRAIESCTAPPSGAELTG
ncbi:MAG TPA: 3-dehydroquinate synthase [Candidatus Eremiobacteraceae bacterium]|nr:3-dehydroquinate synthase [Candidatus Eremiobacteraceae bacterium]